MSTIKTIEDIERDYKTVLNDLSCLIDSIVVKYKNGGDLGEVSASVYYKDSGPRLIFKVSNIFKDEKFRKSLTVDCSPYDKFPSYVSSRELNKLIPEDVKEFICDKLPDFSYYRNYYNPRPK